ncbi:unnamed protein product [Penicillium discolor]
MSSPYFSSVLVFGATGEVGSAAVLEAHARSARVTIAMRDVAKPNEWISSEHERAAGLQRITADLTNQSSDRDTGRGLHIRGTLQRLDAWCYHSAPGRWHSARCIPINRAGENRGATKADIRSIKFDHFTPWQPAQIEIGLEEIGLPHTALRAGFFAGNPLRTYLDKSMEPKQVNLLAPNVLHDPIDSRDIGSVAGAVLVNLRQYTDGYQATSESTPRKDTEQWDIINREIAAVGKSPVKVNDVTVEQYLKNMAALHVPDVVSKSLAKCMVETGALYAIEDFEKDRGNVGLLTSREATSFKDFVKREIPRYL